MSKTKISHIELTLTESPDFRCPKRFSTMAAVDSFLSGENRRAEKSNLSGYYKTDFCITFEDGNTYEGRYDIGSDHPNLSSHVLNFCLTHSGRQKPSDWDDDRWKRYTDYLSIEIKEGCGAMLDNYFLDEDHLA